LSTPSILVVGRPESGKSTFLAALFHALRQIPAAGLKLDALPLDASYLNTLVGNWEQFKTVDRTTTSVQEIIPIKLIDENGEQFELQYPDLSGEEFDDQWIRRTCNRSLADSIQRASGLILFIGPNIKEPITIKDIFGEEELGQEGNDVAPLKFDPLEAPDDVVIVDLLQIFRLFGPKVPIRTSVVFSAWDIVDKYGHTSPLPSDWCSNKLPLLTQFLRCNSSTFDVKLFGVSAIGGDLVEDRQTLLQFTKHSDRIFVVEEDGSRHNDIRSPLNWVTGRT
jgi:hypothetical protein